MPQTTAFIGIRHFEVDTDDEGNYDLDDDQVHIGVRLTFWPGPTRPPTPFPPQSGCPAPRSSGWSVSGGAGKMGKQGC